MFRKLVITTCVGMFTLSAFALTSTASAQWMVNGTNLTGTAKLASTAAVDQGLKLTSAGVTIECRGKNLEFVAPQIESGDKGSASSLVFTECSVNSNCTVTKTIGLLPLITTAALDGALAANITFLPKTGSVLTTIKFSGNECALLGTQPVTGKGKFLAPTGQDERLLQLIEAKVTEASGELKVGSSSAGLTGSALQKLENDAPWSFL